MTRSRTPSGNAIRASGLRMMTRHCQKQPDHPTILYALVLLERANEALGAAVPLGRPHKGGRTRDAQEGQLLLEGVGHVLTPVIVPDGQTTRDLLGESAKMAPYALADRLERLEAGGPARGMDAHALG